MSAVTKGQIVQKFEPFKYNGTSVNSILISHSYKKYIRINPDKISSVSGHGGTTNYAQWKLHSVTNNIFKLQNLQSSKYLRIIQNGKTVDVGGSGGKYTLFKVHTFNNNNIIQPNMIQLESIQFPGYYIAVNHNCTVYSYNSAISNNNNNKNDINLDLYMYAKPQLLIINDEKQNDTLKLKAGIVVIQHELFKSLRVEPGNELNINSKGGRGIFARWKLEIIDNNNKIKFKSTKSNKYLRIINNGQTVNVGGGGGSYTIFKYNSINKTLESNKFPAYYLAINKTNNNIVSINTHQLSMDTFGTKFNISYLNNVPQVKNKNNNNNIVIIQHAFNKSLRVNPSNELLICGNGGNGKFARWNIEYYDNNNKIKLKSTKSNKYLRIINNGKTVNVGGGGGIYTIFKYDKIHKTLESNKFGGYYLCVSNNNNIISVNPTTNNNINHSLLQFNIIITPLNNSKNNGFNIAYDINNYNNKSISILTVLRSKLNSKSLRVKPGNLELANCNGGFGGLVRWNLTWWDNNNYIKLQNIKTNKYIRIFNNNTIDIRGSGGKYTKFRVHLIKHPNIIALESMVFTNKYISIDNKGNVNVYDNNNNNNGFATKLNECMFSVLMKNNNNNNNIKASISLPIFNNNNNNNNQLQNGLNELVKSQQILIEQQKSFIDQLQNTVASQQKIINNFNSMIQPGHQQQNQQNIYPVLQSNINNNNNCNYNGTTDNNGENQNDDADGYEYVSNPGSSYKK